MAVSRRGLFGLAAGVAVAGPSVVETAIIGATDYSVIAATNVLTIRGLSDFSDKVWIEWARKAILGSALLDARRKMVEEYCRDSLFRPYINA